MLSSPESGIDYSALRDVPLSFAACAQRSCTNVNIVDDLVDEPTESFFVTLERTLDLDRRIQTDPVDGVIEIEDNDGNDVIEEGQLFGILSPGANDAN